MNNDRSIDIHGRADGIISSGDNSINTMNQNKSNNPKEVSDEIEEILEQLVTKYPNAQQNQKEIVLQMEIQNKLKDDPTFKHRFISAAKSGGIELVKVVTNNPFISVPLETIKGWIETEQSS